MPCISIQFDPAVGPIIQVVVAPPNTPATQAERIQLPSIQMIPMLVDTGASNTCISSDQARSAGLVVSGKATVASATHSVPVNTYLADIVIPFGNPAAGSAIQTVVAESVQVMEFNANNPAYHGLLGRDILSRGFFSMAAFDRRFTFCM